MTAPPPIIDSHTHLDSPEFEMDREEIISRGRAAGIIAFISIGAGGEGGLTSARNVVKLSEKYSDVFASVGVHPHHGSTSLGDLSELKALAKHPKVVAIGETGLDFFRDWCPKDDQYRWFRAQIELALEVDKPIIIHSRSAAEECLSVLKEMNAGKVGGVFHCYSEDAEFAKKLAQINFLVSFPGSVTFKKAEALRHAAREIPLSQIMVETDAPYMAPEPNRGKRCESAFVIETAKRIALERKIEYSEFAKAVTENSKKFFKLKNLD